MQSPELLQELRCSGEVSCAALRGGQLAAGAGGAVLLWQWEGGQWKLANTIHGAHRYGVTALEWAGSGRLLASGGVDGALRLWTSGLVARRLLAAPGAPTVRALCWVGCRLLAGHDDGNVRVWLWARHLLLATVQAAGGGALHALCVSNGLLLAACTEGVLKVWALHALVTEGDVARPLLWEDGAHDLGALCAAAGEEGLAATGGQDAVVRLWRLQGDEGVVAGSRLQGHEGAVTALSWAGLLLASAALDRTARLWLVQPHGTTAQCLLVLGAHERYLTAVSLSPSHLLLTASNDRSVRCWALDGFSPDTDLETACNPQLHYGTGDLQGIEPLDEELVPCELTEDGGKEAAAVRGGGGGARLAASHSHGGAVNAIVSCRGQIVTASSDGCVRIFRWEDSQLLILHTVAGDGYPLLALDAADTLLAAGGLGGGCALLQGGRAAGSLRARAAVRALRLLHPLLLLGDDSGTVLLYDVSDSSPQPVHTYAGHCGAALCVSWLPPFPASSHPPLAASGDEAGTLLLHVPPPNARTLLHKADAHEIGVLSMDFAPPGAREVVGGAAGILATAGCDGLVKLWLLHCDEELSSVSLRVARVILAAGGGMSCVRWGRGEAGTLLAAGGAERWARVWRVGEKGGGLRATHVAAAPVRHAGGAVSVELLEEGYLAVGTMSGELSVWELPVLQGGGDGGDEGDYEGDYAGDGGDSDSEHSHDDYQEECSEEEWALEQQWDSEARWWGRRRVAHWLREGVGGAGSVERRALRDNARRAALTGAALLDHSVDDLVAILMDGMSETEQAVGLRAQLVLELRWLRAAPPPPSLLPAAPHALLCPLSHALLRWPVRASDGMTYERAALREWFVAAGGCVSLLSEQRLRSSRVRLNQGTLQALRAFLSQHGAGPAEPAQLPLPLHLSPP